ncbi:MAG: hypothetical protein HN348_02640 [Proteobacteria bacterium]|jgi:hypothetical protein|nr:hypothetical protein [Pseudomonadota bacterium]
MSDLQQGVQVCQAQAPVCDTAQEQSSAVPDQDLLGNSCLCSQAPNDFSIDETPILQNASSCPTETDFFTPETGFSIGGPGALTDIIDNDKTPGKRAPATKQGERWGSSAGAAATKALRQNTTGLLESLPGLNQDQSNVLGKAGDAMAAPLSFAQHLLGDRQVAATPGGHYGSSAAKAGVDTMLGRVPKAGGGFLGKALSTIDGFLDVDNPAKLATSMGAELVPGSWTSKLASGGIDGIQAAGTMLTGRPSEGFRAGEIVQDNAVNGEYSAVGTASTYLAAMATGDDEVLDAAVDNRAERGDRGIWNAMGNFAGDSIADAAGHRGGREEQARFVPPEEFDSWGLTEGEAKRDCWVYNNQDACTVLDREYPAKKPTAMPEVELDGPGVIGNQPMIGRNL